MRTKGKAHRLKAQAVRDGLIELGAIQRVSFTSAAGLIANQKVELDVLQKDKALLGLVVAELSVRVEEFDPDVIIPAPYGADELGKKVASRLDLPISYMDWVSKTPGSKLVKYRSERDRKIAQNAKKITVLDDVYTTGESIHAIAGRRDIVQKMVGAVTVWSRLQPEDRLDVPYPTASIVEEHVPLMYEEALDG